jgi:hypothetical protein
VQIDLRTSNLIDPVKELVALVRIRSKSCHIAYLSMVDDEAAGWIVAGSLGTWLLAGSSESWLGLMG